jgi:hypothetical protein
MDHVPCTRDVEAERLTRLSIKMLVFAEGRHPSKREHAQPNREVR